MKGWQSMKRIITAILATVLLGGALVALSATAHAAPSPACYSVSSTPTDSGPWIFNSTFDWHVTDGWLYTFVGCHGYVWFQSRGWRFDARQCGDAWVRRPAADGSTYVVPGSRKRVCGGQTVLLVSGMRPGRPIRIEAVSYNPQDRIPTAWPVATVLR